jgi:L-aminopeptidase/D-esterase-like protein
MLGVFAFCSLAPSWACAQTKCRARDLGVPFEGNPGRHNAITDVHGVEVGHATLISGKGALHVGKGPVRTGVTAILPRGKKDIRPVFAGWFSLNGNGEMTGTTWVEESGQLEGPILTTNTYSVGTVRDAVLAWLVKHFGGDLVEGKLGEDFGALPVVAETWDGDLNDIKGFHVKKKHVWQALDTARSGAVPEGNVGGGTGMTLFDFKGGIGTASRVLPKIAGGYTVGVLGQCNFGERQQLLVAGVPVGRELHAERHRPREKGSVILVVATDAPLVPHQLKRLAKRCSHGLARTGSASGNGSGDIFIAFSTANKKAFTSEQRAKATLLANEEMDALFEATVQATEEAIINALVAAKTMTGRDGNEYEAIPHDKLKEVLKRFNRLVEKKPRP